MPVAHQLTRPLKLKTLPKSFHWITVCHNIASWTSASPLVSHLVKNNYVIHSENDAVSRSYFKLNTLGNVVIKNWEAEWKKFLPFGKIQINELNLSRLNGDWDDKIMKEFRKLIPLPKHFVAAVNFKEESSDETKRKLLIALSRQSTSSKEEVQEIQIEQIRFIKNYFNKPARVKLCGGKNNDGVVEHQKILYESDDDTFCLQDMREYPEQKGLESGCTIFSLDLQQIFRAVMADAYGIRDNHQYLKLHPKLAPVKVVVLHECESSDKDFTTITQLTGEVCTMLRSINVTCWNGMSRQLTLTDVDELGAPFSIILPTSIFENGILFLRNLNTTIKMEVHMSTLKEKLLKYLGAS
ncbi:uncharacterized protein LOC120338508 [Styela clava]